MEQVYSKLGWTNKNKQLPVMFMSGGDDPCRKSDKDFKKAVYREKNTPRQEGGCSRYS